MVGTGTVILEDLTDAQLQLVLMAIGPNVDGQRLNSTHWIITRDERGQSIVNARLARACADAAVETENHKTRTQLAFGVGIGVGLVTAALAIWGASQLR